MRLSDVNPVAWLGAWMSRRFFDEFQVMQLLEQVDADTVEVEILTNYRRPGALGKLALIGAGSAAIWAAWMQLNWAVEAGWRAGATLVGITAGVVLSSFWFRRRYLRVGGHIGVVTRRLRDVEAAIRRRLTVAFSVSLRSCSAAPLRFRLRQLIADSIRTLDFGSQGLSSLLPCESERVLSNFYSNDITGLLRMSSSGANDATTQSGDRAVETLLDLHYLHVSEYCRLLVLCLLSPSAVLRAFSNSFVTFSRVAAIVDNARELQANCERATRTGRVNVEKRAKTETSEELTSLQKLAIVLQDVVDGISDGSLKEVEVEASLRRATQLLAKQTILGDTRILKDVGETSASGDVDSTSSLAVELPKSSSFDRTDIDMVFEGAPLPLEEQLLAKEMRWDFGDEHEEVRAAATSLLGELQFALCDRRDEFAQRERVALAKFYGVAEDELGRDDEDDGGGGRRNIGPTAVESGSFEGVGTADDDVGRLASATEPQNRTWRNEATTTAGIHSQVDSASFLAALAARRVVVNTIGDDGSDSDDVGLE